MLSIVTVVFRDEIALLRLQAVSLARFFRAADVTEILVLVNDVEESATVEAVRQILPAYGPLADRVRIMRPDTLFAEGTPPRGPFARARSALTWLPKRLDHPLCRGWRGNPGWRIQQALKLAAARVATGSHLLVLDAKNHFLAPVAAADFVAPDGRARWRLITVPQAQRAWVTASFRRFGLAPPPADRPLPPSVTPFCVARPVLTEALLAIEARVGPVEAFFATNPGKETEFMLVLAFVFARHGALEPVFAEGLAPPATVFHAASSARIGAVLGEAERGAAKIFAVHRLRAGSMSEEERLRIAALWRERHLVADEAAALALLAGR